jgi:acid phosphatase
VPFLGFVALEKYSCPAENLGWSEIWNKSHKKPEYVRAVVNGKHEKMGGCEDGVGEGCEWNKWHKWVGQRVQRWSDWESVCGKPE